MASFAWPYLRISNDQVIADPWIRYSLTGGQPLLDYVRDWDSANELRVQRRLEVNLAAIALAFDIAQADLRLEAVLTVSTGGLGGQRTRRIYWRKDVRQGQTVHDIDVTIEAADLSQRFILRMELLFVGPTAGGAPLAPKHAGLRLWENVFVGRLEPEEPRLPIEMISFKDAFPESAGALWKLEWSPGAITDEFAGALRVLANADEAEFMDRLRAGDALILKFLLGAVRVQIVRGVLANTDASDLVGTASPTSILGAVVGWLDKAFPGQDLTAVEQAAALDPSRFEAMIAAIDDEVSAGA